MGVLDTRINFKLFLKGLSQKIQGVLARQLPAEQKLQLLLDEMVKDTQAKRITAREIRARMVALADAETAELEPLEALRAKRAKLVAFGGRLLKEKEAAAPGSDVTEKTAQLGQVSQEINALDTPLRSMESTYATLKESYELARDTYKTALAGYERAKANGPTLLLAIKAHQEALQIRDKAADASGSVNASFLDDLERELDHAEGVLHSDQQLERDLDAGTPWSISKEFAEADAATVDANLEAEFRRANA